MGECTQLFDAFKTQVLTLIGRMPFLLEVYCMFPAKDMLLLTDGTHLLNISIDSSIMVDCKTYIYRVESSVRCNVSVLTEWLSVNVLEALNIKI